MYGNYTSKRRVTLTANHRRRRNCICHSNKTSKAEANATLRSNVSPPSAWAHGERMSNPTFVPTAGRVCTHFLNTSVQPCV